MGAEIPFQLGITGGIGSGKSVFSRIFTLMGVPVYESDAESKKMYFNPEVRKQVKILLGEQAYRVDGSPDTAFIADRIYREGALREKLNGIIHPAVALHYRNWLERQSHPYVLKVAALLYEADIARHLNMTAVVISPASLRKERLAIRDSHRSALQVEAIMASQLCDEQKIKLADVVINNDEKHSLIRQAFELQERVLKLLAK